jgi:hypothetical protein
MYLGVTQRRVLALLPLPLPQLARIPEVLTAVSSWDAEWRMLSRPGAKQFSHKAGEYN